MTKDRKSRAIRLNKMFCFFSILVLAVKSKATRVQPEKIQLLITYFINS
jgi:hypothetical protein